MLHSFLHVHGLLNVYFIQYSIVFKYFMILFKGQKILSSVDNKQISTIIYWFRCR